MGIYIILFVLIIFLYLVLKDRKNGTRNYCIIIGLCLAVVAGLRNEKLGLTDTEKVYKVFFERILKNDFSYVLTLKDTFFQILTYYYTRLMGANFKIYVFLFTCPYILVVSFFIYKYSNRKWLSFIMFVCLHYYEISFTLMRQINGMAILILALHFLINNQDKKFVIAVVLASLFHKICLIFLILYFFKNLKLKKWILYLIFVTLFICSIYSKEIIDFFFKIINDERFGKYEYNAQTKNRVLFWMNFIFWFFELLNFSNNSQKVGGELMFWSTTICMMVSPFIIIIGEFSRIAYLFGIAHIVILPDSLELIQNNKQKMFAEFLVMLLFMVYFLNFLGPQVNIIPYYM